MKEIPLTKGKVSLIDDDDFERVSQHKWLYLGGYAVSSTRINGKNVRLNRFIMNTPSDLVCDHINGDPLDNRKSNLRNCTPKQNLQNRGINKNKKWKYKGVHQMLCGRFFANIRVDGKIHHIGTYATQEEAARARDEASKKYFGEFARLNFPQE